MLIIPLRFLTLERALKLKEEEVLKSLYKTNIYGTKVSKPTSQRAGSGQRVFEKQAMLIR